MKYQLEKIAPLGRIGLIALATDFYLESDLRRMLPEGVDVFTNRVLNKNPLTLENLQKMSDDITRAASGILPGFGVDAMIYGCTSGAIAIGHEKIRRHIHESCPGIPVTNPVLSLLAALEHLKVNRISMITPYNDEINKKFQDYLESQGIEVLSLFGLGMKNDIDVTKIPIRVIRELAIEHCRKNAEALFLSCSALRASCVIEEIESELDIPVISSNQALAWHVMQQLQASTPIQGFGRLLK